MSCTPLTDAERARIQFVITYFQQNYEKPIDQLAADALKGLHDRFGYSSEIKLLEALRDSPHTALLQGMLNVSCSGSSGGGGNVIGSTTFGSLNNAVYEPGRGIIYAVRGGRIFSINATTGALLAYSTFAVPDFDDAYVTYSPATDSLYASIWMNFPNTNNGDGKGGKFLYQINPDTLSVVNTYDIAADQFSTSDGRSFSAGPRQLISIGNFIFGLFYTEPTTLACYPFRFTPASGTFLVNNSISVQDLFRTDLAYDSVNFKLWLPSAFGAVHGYAVSNLADSGVTLSLTLRGYGICYRPANSHAYVTMGNGVIRHRKTDNAAPTVQIDVGRPAATPYNIRYNSVDDRIYLPTWADNTVVVINPADDSFVVKTGFDAPFDVVFTPTKAFAVQHGNQGLKEIV